MLRLRMCSALLSLLTLATVILAWADATGARVIIALLAASACLAFVSPFDAPNPQQRIRVFLACLAYFVVTVAALVLAHAASAPVMLVILLVILSDAGVGLTCWAFATRKRRRDLNSRRYYDGSTIHLQPKVDASPPSRLQ